MYDLTVGTHIITLQVSDGINDPVANDITVEVIDTSAPKVCLRPNRRILWPPNQRMVDIIIVAHTFDNSGGPVTLTASVSSNEAEDGLWCGDQSPDWTEPVIDQDNGIITLQLRAERSLRGLGRVYKIMVTATDESGNSSEAKARIFVPRFKRWWW